MRVAILGTRGIPARYGGFETFAEELSKRLAARGYSVEVHCRRGRCGSGGVEKVDRVFLPAIYSKHLETISHTALSVVYIVWLKLLRRPGAPDVVLVCNGANAPLVWPLRLAGIPYGLNVDGIERKRRKWGQLGTLWYRLGEWFSARLASRIVSDAEVIADYYRETYGVQSSVITYGYNTNRETAVSLKLRGEFTGELREELSKFDLEPEHYILYVSRLEPENNAHVVIEAYRRVKSAPPLVIVGNAPYSREYIASLRAISEECPGVRFYGFQFGPAYEALQLGARVYIQATEVGGTHPALVEGMGFANCILANETPENREVLADCGVYYSFNNATSLRKRLEDLLRQPELVARLRVAARSRAEEHYSWSLLTERYEQLFRELVKKSPPQGADLS